MLRGFTRGSEILVIHCLAGFCGFTRGSEVLVDLLGFAEMGSLESLPCCGVCHFVLKDFTSGSECYRTSEFHILLKASLVTLMANTSFQVTSMSHCSSQHSSPSFPVNSLVTGGYLNPQTLFSILLSSYCSPATFTTATSSADSQTYTDSL